MSKANLGLGALTALVVGSMIGSGIFSLPQNMAANASAGTMLIGWGITGVGMLMLAFIFQRLSLRKPSLNSGIYAYAKDGFGDYVGFSSAWGYWTSAFIANVSYFVIIFSTLGYFFPIFGEGNTYASIIVSSILLWIMHFIISSGIKNATIINQIITIAKIVPIITFLIFVGLAFKSELFTLDFWGKESASLGSVSTQLKNMMIVTVWVFIGIEGASLYSARAKKRSNIGVATVLGFLLTLLLLVMVNIFSLGVMSQMQLSELTNPSMAYVLEYAVGPWGAKFISVGLIISVVGALLAWTLFCAEVLFSASLDDTMPSFLKKENKHGVPSNALLLSNIGVQLFLIITFYSEGTYNALIYLSASMILVPYFLSAAYGVKIAWRYDGYQQGEKARNKDLLIGVLALLYSGWLLYAAGIKYLLLASLLYAPSTIVYIVSKYKKKQQIFKPFEIVIVCGIILLSLFSMYGLISGTLSL